RQLPSGATSAWSTSPVVRSVIGDLPDGGKSARTSVAPLVAQPGLALGALVGQRAPAAGGPGLLDQGADRITQLDHGANPVDRAGPGGFEEVYGHVLVLDPAGVEVVGGQPPGWNAQAKGLDERVEAEVLPVRGVGPAGLQVDEDLARPRAFRPTEGEIDLAGEHDALVHQVGVEAALRSGAPAGGEWRPPDA